MAKEFLKQHQHVLYAKDKAKKRLKRSPSVIEIVDLEEETVSKVVDLSGTEPKSIQRTMNRLNRTINRLNISISNINNNEVIDLCSTPHCSRRKSLSLENEVQVINVVQDKKNPKPTTRLSRLHSNDDVIVLDSNVKKLKKTNQQRFASSDDLIVNVSRLGVRSCNINSKQNRGQPTSKRQEDYSQTPTRKRKLRDISNISTTGSKRFKKKRKLHDSNISPARKQPTGIVDKYYSKINRVVQKMKRKTTKKFTGKSPSNRISPRNSTHLKRRSSLRLRKLHQPLKKKVADSNIFNPNPDKVKKTGLRPVVIDGSNVAMGHGKGQFSVRGIQIVVDYFVSQGHQEIKLFLPLYRKENITEEQLTELKSKCEVVFTPSSLVNGSWRSAYDDRYIIQYAVEFGGVVVSGDQFRDLKQENEKWLDVIENRLLMPTFVDDFLMFPVDPLGKRGPHLDQYLNF